MATDSRLSLDANMLQPGGMTKQVSVGQSDSNYKLFQTPNGIGISTFGAADIKGVPIGGFVESFFNEPVCTGDKNVQDVAQSLLQYFRKFNPIPQTHFHVSGYTQANGSPDQQVWKVSVADDKISQMNAGGQQGVAWGGEADTLTRLLQPVAELDHQGLILQPLPHYSIPWGFFTLQDAIDFSVFAVRSTIDAMRFQPRPKTVGGPVYVLVIKQREAIWIQRKVLRVG